MNETELFWHLLDQTLPRVRACWDREKHEMILDRMELLMGNGSSGEIHMGRFFRDVWKWGGVRSDPFDLIEAMGTLDDDQVQIIRTWLTRPVWP